QDKVIDLLTPVCGENPIKKYPAGCEIKAAKTKPYLGLAENYCKPDSENGFGTFWAKKCQKNKH
ncbi:MAG UNVERIFIED_CONTAM: hypothetical protein LVR29_16815, partial [Microcystis novacekii LVE1205-3]